MNEATRRKRLPASSPRDLFHEGHKRLKVNEGIGLIESSFSSSWRFESELKQKESCSKLVDYSNPFSSHNLLKQLDPGKFGSVTNEIRDLIARRTKFLDLYYSIDPTLSERILDLHNKVASMPLEAVTPNIVDLNDGQGSASATQLPHLATPVVIIDSDDDNLMDVSLTKSPGYVNVFLNDVMKPSKNLRIKNVTKPSKNLLMKDCLEPNLFKNQTSDKNNDVKNQGEYIGIDDDMGMSDNESDTHSDGFGNIWNEMAGALESSKDPDDILHDEREVETEFECEHSFIMKDDIGDVCRICGVIRRGIESIIEYNFSKGPRSSRTYHYEGRASKDFDGNDIFPDEFKPSSSDFEAAEIYPHPRHRKEMKPHQIEGFNFLVSNLVSENPGGCIMAHAPGSGKTFMIISFLQSFMAKYPSSRPLVVLPRGIMPIWKKEFLRWQVEDLPLYDFYSVKADGRVQQLEVLKRWSDTRSILFLGYKQFSSIVCDSDIGKAAVACQQILLVRPSILILDEGHTPRNQDTDVLTSLERVQTQRKVVLSGTLYQNHVREVFNILNLVRPRFLKLDTSKTVVRRILSRADISNRKSIKNSGREFYEIVENTLLKDDNHKRKVTVIQDLRDMTKRVLHYYKGDNLDELPGLVDFSVFLKLGPWQKSEVDNLQQRLGRKFSINAQGSAIYTHPSLKVLAQNSGVKDRVDGEKIDAILEKLDIKQGVKAKFYLNLLQLCESNSEKLLVFSQYLLPLKFLERLTSQLKGYRIGTEMFLITGDSDNDTRETAMEKFNTSPQARVFFGSIKACGEGISLVGASRVIILDVHLNPSVTRQAIGRAFRPGQLKKVYVYRLIASRSPEEADHETCFKKELIAKMWFEWDECNGHQDLELEKVSATDCEDEFLQNERLSEDVIAVCKR